MTDLRRLAPNSDAQPARPPTTGSEPGDSTLAEVEKELLWFDGLVSTLDQKRDRDQEQHRNRRRQSEGDPASLLPGVLSLVGETLSRAWRLGALPELAEGLPGALQDCLVEATRKARRGNPTSPEPSPESWQEELEAPGGAPGSEDAVPGAPGQEEEPHRNEPR
jgi:hypothetical protein